MPQRRAQQQGVTSMQQPVLQMPIVPHRQQESQPNPQPIVVQAGQPLQRQVLPVQTQMEQGATKEASQQVRTGVLSWVSLQRKHIIQNFILWSGLDLMAILVNLSCNFMSGLSILWKKKMKVGINYHIFTCIFINKCLLFRHLPFLFVGVSSND